MRVSCICVCHDKPDVTHEAIGSILRQTYPDWEAIVVDSGVLYDAGYYEQFTWRNDPRIKLIRSHETRETRLDHAMAPWCFNECFRKGWVTGDLVVYLCDDDLLYPNAFETFASYYRKHPDAQALYASQDVGVIYPNGWHAIIGERRAQGMGGRSCNGRRMDCEIDYLQFCHRMEVLKRFSSDEFWPESKYSEEHADGIFMERVGALVPIHPVDVKVSQNRRTPRSLNIPMSSLSTMDCMANGIPLLPGLTDRPLPPTGDTPLVTVAVIRCDDREKATTALTYPCLEVIAIEDDTATTRNQALLSARGEYFLPLSPGYQLLPDAIERLLDRIRTHPLRSAVTGYLLGMKHQDAGSVPSASVKNVCGSALYRTADLRAVGGFDTRPETATNDWSTFFKLVNSGRHVDILPEHLFRRVDESVSPCETAKSLNSFVTIDRAFAAEREALWQAMAGYERRLEEMAKENRHLNARLNLLRYRIADRVHALLRRIPFVVSGLKWVLRSIGKTLNGSSAPFHSDAKLPGNHPVGPAPMLKNASAAP